MKEAVMVSHNQDAISGIHKIVGFCKFFVSYGCPRFATLIRISCVAAIRSPRMRQVFIRIRMIHSAVFNLCARTNPTHYLQFTHRKGYVRFVDKDFHFFTLNLMYIL